MVYGSLVGFSIFPWQVPKKSRSPCKQNIIFLMCDIWNMKTRHYLLKLRFLLHVSIVKWWKNGAQKFRDFWISNLWQRWTTQTSFILKFSVSGKISYINFFSIRTALVSIALERQIFEHKEHSYALVLLRQIWPYIVPPSYIHISIIL